MNAISRFPAARLVMPYRDSHSHNKTKADYGTYKRKLGLSEYMFIENNWRAHATADEIMSHVTSSHIKKRWYQEMANHRGTKFFVLNPVSGLIPCDAFALAIIASIADPNTVLICNPQLKPTGPLFEEFRGSNSPPPCYPSLAAVKAAGIAA